MKRLFIVLLICMLCVAGCSKKDKKDSEVQTESNDVQTSQAVQQTETEAEDVKTTEAEPETEEVDVLSFYEWEVTNDGIKITNYKGNEERVVMPSIIDNKMVVDMKSGAFNGNVFMKEFVASEYMEYAFGDFGNCPNLTYIEFPGAEKIWDDIESDTCERLVLPKCKYLNNNNMSSIQKYMKGLKILELPSLESMKFFQTSESAEPSAEIKASDIIAAGYKTTLEKVILPDDYDTAMKLYKSGSWTRSEEDGEVVEMSPEDILLIFGCKTLEVNGTVYSAK